jgi:protein gp37
MSKTTRIEWCDSTFNPWIGCTRVSPGCDNCYAAVSTPARTMGILWGAGQLRHRTSPANLADVIRWNRDHALFERVHGRRRRVFCASLADVLDNDVPDIWRTSLYQLIESTPNLDWLLLTKRIGNAPRLLPSHWMGHGCTARWPAHVAMGISVVNQAEADRDIPKLLHVPAARRFLSCEPLLGPLRLWKLGAFDFDESSQGAEVYPLAGLYAIPDCDWPGPKLDWVIVGGESGPYARPMNPAWVKDIRDQCARHGTPFFFKQWGAWMPGHNDDEVMHRGSKHTNGRLLDGRTHDDFLPQPKTLEATP